MPEGTPKTLEERRRSHLTEYRTTNVPPKGTGQTNTVDYGNKTAVDIEKEFEAKPGAFEKKISHDLIEKAALVANLLTIKVNNLLPWYKTERKPAVDTTSESLYSDQVRPGQLVILTHIAAKSATTAPTTLELSIDRRGEDIILTRQVPSAADISIDFDGQVIMVEGDRAKATFYGSTAGDLLDASFSGYQIKA